MRNFTLLTLLLIGFATSINGQSWMRYEADVLPSETEGSSFDLTSLSQDSPGADFEEVIVDDADIDGNTYLRYIQPNGTKMYRFLFQDTSGTESDGTDFTIVARIKGVSDWSALGLQRVFDIQLRNGASGTRDELRFGYETNRIELDRTDIFVDSLVDLTEWHIFRMVTEGDNYSVYLDEGTEPVLQGVSEAEHADRYLKIGDGSGDAVGGLLDWIALDTTGAYTPAESPLDDSFTGVGSPPIPDDGWMRYEADVLPSETEGSSFDLTSLSQDSPGADFEEVIVDDAAIDGNSYLRYIQPNGTKMYRFLFQDTSGTESDGTDFTIVARIKGVSDWSDLGLQRVFDIQLRNGASGTRDELRFGYETNRIELDRTDIFVDSLVDLTEWHIYRMVTEGDNYSVYLDEGTDPILQGVSEAEHADRYLKIGDGSGDAVGGLLDWIALDTTGAYTPTDKPLDSTFTGYIDEPEPEPTDGWMRYEADVLPSETEGSSFDLTSLSQDSPGADFEEVIVDDAAIDGNSYLRYIQPNGTKMYRFLFQDTSGVESDGTDFTIVARIKGVSDWSALGLQRVFDIQLRNGASGTRDELRFGYETNRIELDRTDIFVDSLVDLTDWHIYRMVTQGDNYSVYLDEGTDPILQGVSEAEHADRYLKIGDGSGDAVGGLLDWIALDTTGAYTPTDKPLDESFTGFPIESVSVNEENIDQIQLKFFPNPFENQVNIDFNLRRRGRVMLDVYDIMGQHVKRLINQEYSKGPNQLTLNVSQLPQGSYFFYLRADGIAASYKMIKN